MTPEEAEAEALLADYRQRLASLRYGPVGIVEVLILSPEPGCHRPVHGLCVLPGVGPEGQYPGKQWWRGKRVPGRQISAVNAEVLDALEIPHEVPGDNLIIRGVDLARFSPGETIRVGDALLTVTDTPHRPCAKLARRTSVTKMRAISGGKFRGVLLDAREPATLRVGDPVERLVLSLFEV